MKQKELLEIVRKYTDINIDEETLDLDFKTDLGMDSFSLMSLLLEIEKHFNCNFDVERIICFSKVRDLLTYVEEYEKESK